MAGLHALSFGRIAILAVIYFLGGTSKSDAEELLSGLGVLSFEPDQAVVFNSLSRPSFVVFGDAGNSFVSGEAGRLNENRQDHRLINYEKKF